MSKNKRTSSLLSSSSSSSPSSINHTSIDELEQFSYSNKKRTIQTNDHKIIASSIKEEISTNNDNNEIATSTSLSSSSSSSSPFLSLQPYISSFTSLSSYSKAFDQIASELICEYELMIGNQSHTIIEIEFYWREPDFSIHSDTYSHCHPIQFNSSGQWYFHRASNKITSGYKEGNYKGN